MSYNKLSNAQLTKLLSKKLGELDEQLVLLIAAVAGSYPIAIEKREVQIVSLNSDIKDIRDALIANRLDKLHSSISTITDMDVDQWLDEVKKLYTITHDSGLYTIKSNARNWDVEMSWPRPGDNLLESMLDVDEKILQLVQYKLYDRKRGIGSSNKDITRLEELSQKGVI